MFGSWETLGRASYDWYDYHGIYIYDYAGKGIPPYTENYDAADGTWWDFQGDASRVFFKRHRVTLGTEFRQDIEQEQVNYDIQPFYRYLDDHRSSRDSALYFQDEYSIRKNLALVAGFRSDWHEKFENTWSPRVGLVFTPKPNTDVKATYSWAFRAPNSYESFYSANKSNTANSSLKPESIRSWELDVDHRFGKTYSVSGAGYLNRIDDLIRLRLDRLTGRPQYMNSTPRETKGIELELGAKWPGGLEGAISHSLQDSRSVVTGHDLTLSPKQLAKANLSVPLGQRKLFASVEAQYTSRRRTIAGTDLGGFFIMNTTLYSRKLWNDLDLSASLYNVFDKRYADSADLQHEQASIPQDGRNFRVKLAFRPHLTAR